MSSPFDLGASGKWTSWVWKEGGFHRNKESRGGPNSIPCPTQMPPSLGSCCGLRIPPRGSPSLGRGLSTPGLTPTPSPAPCPQAHSPAQASEDSPAPARQRGLVPGPYCLASHPSPTPS